MKKGFTLIETTIAIALLSMCVIGFLQALNVAMLGTETVRKTNSAMELARSQMEYIQQQDFILHNDSETSKYGCVPELPSGFNSSDIQVTVYNVSIDGEVMDNNVMQQLTVNVSYSPTKYVELTDHKAPRYASLSSGSDIGFLVTKDLDIPTIPGVFGWLCGWGTTTYWGYYYVFETGTTTTQPGPISVMWTFNLGGGWNNINSANLYLYKYSDVEYDFPGAPGEGYLVKKAPPSGYLNMSTSWFSWGEREMAAVELEDMDPGKYVAYYYNPGICLLIIYYGRSIPPSESTITYFK